MSFLEHSKSFKGIVDIFLHDPRRYLPVAQLVAALMDGESALSKAEREAIALYVSVLNDCHYCVGSHRAVLAALGADEAMLGDLAAGSRDHAAARLRPVLDLAHKLTATPGRVAEDDVAAARAAGWPDSAIEDAIAIVSLFSLLNRLVDGMGIKGSAEGFRQAGAMVAEMGYGPVVQMVRQKAEAA